MDGKLFVDDFFFNDTATTEIYTLSLHDALPISGLAPACPLPCAAGQDRGPTGVAGGRFPALRLPLAGGTRLVTERSCGAAARRVGPRLCRTPSTSPTRGLGHDTGNHPERAERITAIEASLQQRDWLGYERRQAAPATREAIVAVHAGEYVDTVRSMSERGGAFDADTLVGPGSYEAAASAAGAACGMAEALLA